MLKTRIITACILVAILLSSLFLLSFPHFAMVLGVLFVIGAWEWGNFAGLNQPLRIVYAVLVLALMVFVWRWLGFGRALNVGMQDKLKILLLLTVLFWVAAVFWVVTYPKTSRMWANLIVQLLMGIAVLVPAWLALLYLQSQHNGQWLIIIAATTVICADTGAYFTGRKWGRKKLAAAVSPGKTLEGCYGGIALSFVFAAVVAIALSENFDNIFDNAWLVLMVVVAALVSIFGDLFESMLKRHRGIKDSGVILPGHGGVLDRIDSITAAAPVFAFIYILSGWSL